MLRKNYLPQTLGLRPVETEGAVAHSQLFALTPGSPYYDNVRPLCYSDSDAVLLCFDISRPETMDSALKKVRLRLKGGGAC